MNYQIMTDDELVHYLSLYSDDPIVKRLMVANTALVRELEDKIEELESDIEQLKEDKGYWKDQAGRYMDLSESLQSKIDMWDILATKNLE
jgi:TolA-binding protein